MARISAFVPMTAFSSDVLIILYFIFILFTVIFNEIKDTINKLLKK